MQTPTKTIEESNSLKRVVNLTSLTAFLAIASAAKRARRFSSPHVIYLRLHRQMPVNLPSEAINDEHPESVGRFSHHTVRPGAEENC
jgi:hypothetical protein